MTAAPYLGALLELGDGAVAAPDGAVRYIEVKARAHTGAIALMTKAAKLRPEEVVAVVSYVVRDWESSGRPLSGGERGDEGYSVAGADVSGAQLPDSLDIRRFGIRAPGRRVANRDLR